MMPTLERTAIPFRARALIVDDEPVARRGLRNLLGARTDVEIIGECGNGGEAVEAIRKHHPDLVFLDVQMPGLDGFGVLRTIGAAEMPCVVFVTAFDDYATDAFAVAATDYVVKPYTPERLLEATDRALTRIRERRVIAAHEQLLRALSTSSPEPQPRETVPPDRLIVSIGARSVVVPLADVRMFEADGYCVRVVAGTTSYVLRETLRDLEQRLGTRDFMRVHRSALVRTSAVRELERIEHDRVVLLLDDGTRVPVSRARKESVMEALGSIRG